jgi:[ribosomal protein S5]-alanine N-acetyltransferase
MTPRLQLARSAVLAGADWHLDAEEGGWRLTVDPRDGSRLVARLDAEEVAGLGDLPTAWPPRSLVTTRLVLRRPALADAPDAFARWCTDPAVTRYLTWQPHRDVSETEAFLQGCVETWRTGSGEHVWALALHDDPRILGTLGARRDVHGVILGYALAPSQWGRGYMAEAVRALSDRALEVEGVHRVWAFLDAENRASARTLQKAGFTEEGLLHRWFPGPNLGPVPRDCLVYARWR